LLMPDGSIMHIRDLAHSVRDEAGILAIIAGAAAGAALLRYSVAVPLLVCGLMSGICAPTQRHLSN